MIRRSLSACLSAAALVGALAVPATIAAKPPDLPMNETITVKPPTSLYEALPDAVPTPSLYQLRPTARRTLVGSMLLGINPGLALFATEKILDAPHDHPQRVAGDDVLRDVPCDLDYAGEPFGSFFLCAGPGCGGDWWKWLISHWTARQQPPSPEQNEGYLQTIATGMDFAYQVANDPPASENETPAPIIEVLPMPREDIITCPYLRQQKTDRHACQFADPQIGRDVLENLERLKQADDLIETAKALAADGCLGEAMECCLLAQELCPGSPSADRAAAALFGLCFSADQPEMDAEEAAEEQQSETPADLHSQGKSFRGWLTQWIGWPINVYDPEPNNRILEMLNQSEDMDAIEAEWERIWFTDLPSYLTPERLPGTSWQKRSASKPSIEEKLHQRVSMNLTNTPLRDAIEYIRADLGINIYVDEPALAEKGIRVDKPITVKLEDIALKSALNLIVHCAGLRYVVKEEVVHITTEEHAHGKLQLRIYAVADLLEHADLSKVSGITFDKDEPRENRLIEVITRTILPHSWSAMGGYATIDYFPKTQSLVVNQTADAQDQITDLLAALRRLYNKESKEKEKPLPEEKAEESDSEAGAEQQVRGLMKACHLLMGEGLYEQAAEIARQAFALDPERVMADPLLYKMHLLADTARTHESSEASEPPSCPYCPSIGKPIQGIVPQKKESEPGPTTLLVPPMPPVDYEVVPALDRVLAESAGAEEASEEAEPPSLPTLIEEIMDGIGVDANGSLRLSGEWSCGGSVYHLRYNRGCLAIWKTPDAAKVKP